jgi:biotin carboxyl carrier protein
MSQVLFRPKALRRVSSPEQLDKVARVTLPRQWLALAALIVVVAAAVAWSVFSSVPTLVSGPGYLLPYPEGLEPLASPASGTVSQLSVQTGSVVAAGQTVGAVRTVSGQSVPLVAPYAGRLTEVDSGRGGYAFAGQRIGLIEPSGEPLAVFGYIPVQKAHGLPPGLPVRVNFQAGIGTTYGYVEGTLASISRYAVSEAHLTWVLQNSAEAHSVAQLGPVDEVVVRLTPSSHTPSGWVWASGTGPPGQVPPGLSADVQFVLGSHHPINDVL